MKVDRIADHPEYQNRDARVAVLDKQNIETVFMLPTFACGVEEALKHDVEATMASLHAFNLWLDEDWGFDRPDHRIIAAPIISLADPDKAVEEVEFVLARGAKLVLVRPAPVPGVVKPRSLGDPAARPGVGRVWPRPGFRSASTCPTAATWTIAGMWGGKATFEGFGGRDPLDQILLDDRAIHDTMASMIVHGVFTRHPKLKVVSIENGSYFVYRLIKRLKKAANSHPKLFPEDPVEQLRNNVWIAPYYEDDVPELADGHRRRQDPVRFGLAARRGPGGSGVVHRRIGRIQRRRHPKGHARQRVRPCWASRSARRQTPRSRDRERMDHRGGPRRDRRGHPGPDDDGVRRSPQHLRANQPTAPGGWRTSSPPTGLAPTGNAPACRTGNAGRTVWRWSCTTTCTPTW